MFGVNTFWATLHLYLHLFRDKLDLALTRFFTIEERQSKLEQSSADNFTKHDNEIRCLQNQVARLRLGCDEIYGKRFVHFKHYH